MFFFKASFSSTDAGSRDGERERETESLFDPHEKQTSNSEKSTRCRQKQTEKQSKVGCDKDRKGRCKLEAFEVIKTDTK